MTRDETKKLLSEIVAVYPKFQIMANTIEAWNRRLADCSYERGLELFDKWVESEDSKFAPQLDYFVKGKKPYNAMVVKSDEELIFHIGLTDAEVPEGCEHKHIGAGCLFDQHGREYGSADTDLPYFYDQRGRICNGLGRVIADETGRPV